MASDRKWWAPWAHYMPEVLMAVAAPLLTFYIARMVSENFGPENGERAEAKQKALAASSRLKNIFNADKRDDDDDWDDQDKELDSDEKPRPQDLVLSQYEQTIAMEVVSPNEIPVTFDDIGGLDGIIEDLTESVIYPLTMPHLYSGHSSLLSAPSGVLLYGPPGCGKTMLAKALARESGACFINLHISTLTEKWFGDSNKLVAAVFSLARKLQPTIVFIDEIDAVLGQRRSGEHEASGMVKAEFMTHWDGLASSTKQGGAQRICILGATNRIQDIDEAILRRMPKKFPVGLPNSSQRRQIFGITLAETKLDKSVSDDRKPAFDLDALVRASAGMSGSDIKEACRDAAMVPVREHIRDMRKSGQNMRGIRSEAVRGLQTDDFFGQRAIQQTLGSSSRSKRVVRERGDVESDGGGSTEEVDEFEDEKKPRSRSRKNTS